MISGVITDIQVHSRYDGTVYSQLVTVELDSESVELFDGTVPIVSDELIGRTVDLLVKAHPTAIERSEGATPGIKKTSADEYRIVGTFRTGQSTGGSNRSPLEVDIGTGTIDIESIADVSAFATDGTPAENVAVTAYRLDLVDIQ